MNNEPPTRALECDTVLFKQPSLDCSVFITNVPSSVEELEILKVFGTVGLVNGVHKFNPDSLKRKSETSNPTTCVSVKYYTPASAKRAINELNNYQFDGISCKVSPSKPLRDNNNNDLPFFKTVDVCNYFLGFNKWSSKIISMRKISHEIENTNNEDNNNNNNNNNNEIKTENKTEIKIEKKTEEMTSEEWAKLPVVRCEFECLIEVILDGQKATGIGRGKHKGRFAPKVYEISQKLAVTAARKKAFSKCILLVLNNGKVKVHVNDEEERQRKMREEEDERELTGDDILNLLNCSVIENTNNNNNNNNTGEKKRDRELGGR